MRDSVPICTQSSKTPHMSDSVFSRIVFSFREAYFQGTSGRAVVGNVSRHSSDGLSGYVERLSVLVRAAFGSKGHRTDLCGDMKGLTSDLRPALGAALTSPPECHSK